MSAYYNEIDPFAAAWLRELIKAGRIADGVVDERSIVDVHVRELAGFDQCHFFAGIGVWSYALRLAGWPDDRPVWTGSCPCQPFSSAGKGLGVDDPRHLWPAFHRLIDECRPSVVVGEQVASKDGLAWLDLVHSDLERSDYAAGAVDLCAAGVGAPHVRQRLYWCGIGEGAVADACRDGRGINAQHDGKPVTRRKAREFGNDDDGCSDTSHVADADRIASDEGCEVGRGRDPRGDAVEGAGPRSDDVARRVADSPRTGHEVELAVAGVRGGVDRPERPRGAGEGAGFEDGEFFGMANASSERRQQVAGSTSRNEEADGRARRNRSEPNGDNVATSDGKVCRPGPTNGFWRDPDWLFCRDGKWRPVESSYVEMVDGSTSGVGRGGGSGRPEPTEEETQQGYRIVRPFPLSTGEPARVGRLRGYGNAIVAQQAQAFIEAVMESI